MEILGEERDHNGKQAQKSFSHAGFQRQLLLEIDGHLSTKRMWSRSKNLESWKKQT